MTRALAEACQQAMHVVTADGRIHGGGRAWVFILEQLGWRVGLLRHGPLVWVVEAVYALVARNREVMARLWR
jgi:hypothetical protein